MAQTKADGSEAYGRFREACFECLESLSSFRIERAHPSLAQGLTEHLCVFNPEIIERVYEALSKGKAYKAEEECCALFAHDLKDGQSLMQKHILAGRAAKDGTAEFAILTEGGEYAFRMAFSGSSIYAAIDRRHQWARALPRIILGYCIERGVLNRLEAE